MSETPHLIPRNEFSRLFEADPMPQLVLTPALTVVAANAAYLRMTHTTRKQLLGRRLFEVFPEHPGIDGIGKGDLGLSLDHVIGARAPHALPLCSYEIPDGAGSSRRRYWSIANLPLLDGQGSVIYIVLRIEDFTDILDEGVPATATIAVLQERILRLERDMALRANEKQQLDMQLCAARESLQQLERAKDEFFGNISHEVRTPLTLVLGPIDDLLRAQPPLPEWQKLAVEMIRRNAVHLRKTLNMLLDFARALAGFSEARYEPVDLSAYTRELAGLMRAPIEAAGLRFVVDCPPLPDLIHVDRSHWETVVLNLLSNALKFTLLGSIELSLRPHLDGVELAVRDTGCGISAHEQPHLFERLHRIVQSRGRTTDGAGIGLALVRELVRLHGGGMRIESTLGKGTGFFVELRAGAAHLPQAQVVRGVAEPAPSNADAYVEEAIGWLSNSPPRTVPALRSQRRPRVLLAEDNADMRDYMARVLGQIYDVDSVADGCAALAAIRERPPDLLIASAVMLGMDGIELVRALRADVRNAALPIIMLSANSGDEARIAAIQAGANDYLAKPFATRELLARVVGLLAQGELLRHEQQQRFHAESDRQRLELVLESINDGLLVADRQWRIDLVNSRAAGMLGRSRDALLGCDFRQAVDVAVAEAVRSVMERSQAICLEHFSEARSSWCDYRLSPSPDGGVVVFFVDVTERKLAEERELVIAQHDALTGLANRKLLRAEAERILAAARRQEHRIAVLFVDFDRFKPINDSHGHEVGDKVLKAAADRIARALRAEDLVGRVGGDEFVAVLVGIEDADDVGRVAGNVVEALGRPYHVNGMTLEIGASIGISMFPNDGESIDVLFKRADIAMYAAKRAGRSHFGFYSDGADMASPPPDPAMAERVRAALAAEEFSLDFQPVFSSATTDVVEAEALIRWRQRDGSYVRPQDFLPVAEVTGLIKPLGEWLLRAACAQQQRWLADGLGELSVAVKISAVQFRQKDFAQRVAAVVRDTGIVPARLLLDIAESAMLGNVDESIRVLKELREIGVGVTIRNFGAGDSNVRALSRLPIDKFKVDPSFLQHADGADGARDEGMEHARSNGGNTAVDAIISLGHSLRHEIVVEGIESEADMAYVRSRGCEYYQGYLLASPMPAAEFADWWTRKTHAGALKETC